MGTRIIIWISLTLIISACKPNLSVMDKSIVKEFELERYLGTWYEIARYDHSFERGLVGVTANYSLRNDGKIKVANQGFKNELDGKASLAIGKAKVTDPNSPAHLKVSFFWIFYSDYYIMELDSNYQWAVIGSSSDNYLWILSRTPILADETYNDLLIRIQQRGYDTSALIKVKQK